MIYINVYLPDFCPKLTIFVKINMDFLITNTQKIQLLTILPSLVYPPTPKPTHA